MKHAVTITLTVFFLLSSLYLKAETADIRQLRYIYHSTTGFIDDCDSILIGFIPIGNEDFKPLLKINADRCGIDTTDNRSVVKAWGRYTLLSTDTGDTISHHQQLQFSLNADSMCTSSGVALSNGRNLSVWGHTLIPDRIRLINPETISSREAYLAVTGSLQFRELNNWIYPLPENTYLGFISGQKVLSDFEDQESVETFDFMGATFDSLSIGIKHTNKVVGISGLATMRFDKTRISVSLGYDGKQGIVLNHGTLDSLNLRASGSMTIQDLEIDCDKSHLTYSRPDSTFLFFGENLSMKFNTNVVKFGLGDESNPGARFKNGKLMHMNLTLTDTLSLFGVNLINENLSFEYDSDSAYYKLYGDKVSLRYKEDSISVNMGTIETPGLIVTNGELQHLQLGITAGGSLFGMEVVSQNAVIKWDKTDKQFELYGGPIGLKYDEDSLFVEFGTTDDPGLVFKDGELVKLDATITENFKIGKLEFKSDGLELAYLPDMEHYVVKKGSVTIKVSNDSLVAHFGNGESPGLVIDNGKLQEFNVYISSHEKLFKLDCNIDSLHLAYNKAHQQFEAYGGPVQFVYEKDTIEGRFGTSLKPGIVIHDNKWKKFELDITGNFTLSHLHIIPKNLVFEYDIEKHRIEFYNELDLLIDSNYINCSAGNTNNPGFVFIDGKLENLNLVVNSDFKVGGIELITKDAGIRWTKATKTTELFGKYEMKKLWSAELTLGNADNPGILIRKDEHGKSTFDIEDVQFNLGEVNLGAAVIENLYLSYEKGVHNESIVEAKCTLIISNTFETEAEIEFKKIGSHWEPDRLLFEFQILPPEEGIPIGATDIFLQGIGGSVSNLTHIADIEFGIDIKLSDGVPYDIHPNKPGFLMYMQGDALISKKQAKIDVALLLGAYYDKQNAQKPWNSDIGYADMKLLLDWTHNIYKLSGNLFIPTNYGVKVVGDILLSERVKVFYGDVEIRIPTDWWLIGGKVLGDVGGAMMIFKNDKYSSYAAGWANFVIGCTCCHRWYCGGNWCACLLNAQIGLKYNMGYKTFSQLGATDINNVKRQAQSYFVAPAGNTGNNQNKAPVAETFKTHAYEITISENSMGDMMLCRVGLSQPTLAKDVNINVFGPSGIYDIQYFLLDSVSGFNQIASELMDYTTEMVDEVFFFIGDSYYEKKYTDNWHTSEYSLPKLVELKHGLYEIIVSLPQATTPVFESTVRHSNIQIALNAKLNNDDDVEFNGSIWIPKISATDNAAKTYIFADTDSVGYNGKLVCENPTVTSIMTNGVTHFKSDWTPYGLAPGEKYFYYAMVTDSFHTQVYSAYTPAIELKPAIYGKITNEQFPDSGISNITVFLDLNRNGKLDLHELPEKDENGNVIPEQDGSYKLSSAEPGCITDSTGRFYFDVDRTTKDRLKSGSYQLGFYLHNDFKESANSPFKRDDELLYNGTPLQLEIKIESKKTQTDETNMTKFNLF